MKQHIGFIFKIRLVIVSKSSKFWLGNKLERILESDKSSDAEPEPAPPLEADPNSDTSLNTIVFSPL